MRNEVIIIEILMYVLLQNKSEGPSFAKISIAYSLKYSS